MDGEQPISVLEELLAAKGEHLLRTAVLMAGSQDEGEDLLQAALERVFRKWRSISGDPEGYLRRTMYHLAADGWRRKRVWRAREGLVGRPDPQPDATDAVDRRDHLVRLLRELPPRQRTAIVLRYWEQLTEAETAEAMAGLGTVPQAPAGRPGGRRRERGRDHRHRNRRRGRRNQGRARHSRHADHCLRCRPRHQRARHDSDDRLHHDA